MILVFEIGSTTTVVSAFGHLDSDAPRFFGWGQAPTSVAAGDVTLGLQAAIADLEAKYAIKGPYTSVLASSSAAGGLKMTVHGLVHDMTVKAAREAALGAGANIQMITSGKLRASDLERLQRLSPNIILLAGGVDYGERETALYNAEQIVALNFGIPVIYAGNCENRAEIQALFTAAGQAEQLFIVDNVYPSIDELNILPTREVVQAVFEAHIVHAQGMEKIRDMVDSKIIPTPGAVMLATELLAEEYADVLTIDVGGATTDVHSVTEGSEELRRLQIAPEPKSKRTVEGDLGLFVNVANLLELSDPAELKARTGRSKSQWLEQLSEYHPIPTTASEEALVHYLTQVAVQVSCQRHAGELKELYYTGGKKSLTTGKDLTNIQLIVGTGGALTRLPDTESILAGIADSNPGHKLLPRPGVPVLIDQAYIMASLGVLSLTHKAGALRLLQQSLGLKGGEHVSKTAD